MRCPTVLEPEEYEAISCTLLVVLVVPSHFPSFNLNGHRKPEPCDVNQTALAEMFDEKILANASLHWADLRLHLDNLSITLDSWRVWD